MPVRGAAARSSKPRTVTVPSLPAARASRWRSAGVSTSAAFCNAPEPAIVIAAGSVTQ